MSSKDLHRDPALRRAVRGCAMRKRRSGNAIIEVTFMMPWLLFLFVGVFDFGFYAYMLIAAQNAARAVAIHNSISKAAATDPDGSGCRIAIFELQTAAYGRTMSGCAGPVLTVNSTYETTGTPDGNHAAKVVLIYQAPVMIPIPGVLETSTTITKVAWMRVNPFSDF